MKCPLCSSENTEKHEVINATLLRQKYLKLTGKDFDYLLSQDITQTICNKCGLIFFDPTITGDEKFYMELQKFDWYYMDDKEEFQYAKKYIKNTDRVLEVGSGKGAFAKLLSTESYTGLDLSIHAKELARANDVHIENESIKDHAKKNPESYDVVCSFQVLEHVADPHGFLASKVQSLKKNGLMILAVPSEDSYLKYAVNDILNLPPHHMTKWSDATLEYITNMFCLELVSCYHQKVADVHKKYFMSTFLQSLFLKARLIDNTITRKIVSKCSSLIVTLFVNRIVSVFLPYGHTVIAIYRKK